MRPRTVNFNESPFLAIWETTQACDLACVHCRASAQPEPLPGELSHEEGFALIDDVASMGTPILVLSGGDPLKRADLLSLIRHGKSRGLRVATIPAATQRLTREAVTALRDAALDQMALSLDAPTAEAHDGFRGVPGAFAKTLEAIQWAHDVGLPVQINTVISRANAADLGAMIRLVERLGIVFWEVFFLVPVGRGALVGGLTADEYETAFAQLYDVAQRAPFLVKVTEAPHFRRYCLQQARANGARGSVREPRRAAGPGQSLGHAPLAVNAGKGFVFIAHNGEVFPSGFLPLSAGNVREQPMSHLYREAPLFRALRDPVQLKGRCHRCEYRALCGGSRSRAYAMTGDAFAEDPCCAYLPAAPKSAHSGGAAQAGEPSTTDSSSARLQHVA
jgi:radical SAM protein